MREEVLPKNILMIGPTGVGKTEISRRLAKLAGAPFIKVEATKFTEVGYVGRDVEQIVRDLVEVGIGLVRERRRQEVSAKAELAAEERVLTALVGPAASPATRESFRKRLRQGELDDKEIEIEVRDTGSGMPQFEIPGMPGASVGVMNIGDMLGKAFGNRTKTRRVLVRDSHGLLVNEESDKLLDDEEVTQEAIAAAENDGIVFLDEIDKICVREGRMGGDVSREGVQRDLLAADRGHDGGDQIRAGEDRPHPVHRLRRLPPRQAVGPAARAAGPPADPGRAVGAHREDFVRILTETEASLIKQYVALMETEGVTLDFTDDAIDSIASIAVAVNASVENIGARRLQTVMERVLDEISFAASDRDGETVTDRRPICRGPHRRSRPQHRFVAIYPLGFAPGILATGGGFNSAAGPIMIAPPKAGKRPCPPEMSA